MCVTKYLRDKLFLKEDTVSEKLKKISEMNESVTDLKNGLERLAVTYSEELIDEWYESFEKWYDQQSVKDTYLLKYNKKTCFYIEIKGIQIGCWSGEDNGYTKYSRYPYWGFKKVKDDKSRDSDMIEKIKKEANVAILHDESDCCFLSWGSTTNGAEDLEKYVKAAIELNY